MTDARRRIRWAPGVRALSLSAAVVAGLLNSVGPADARREQHFEVPQSGRIAFPLDATQLVHHAAGDLALFGPDGAPLGLRVHRAPRDGDRRRARLVDVSETEDGWNLLLDLGPSTPRHTRLHFHLPAHAVIARVDLASSDDRRQFESIGSAALFRLGDGTELRSTVVDYPVTSHRWMRLRWPKAAGLPQAERIEVETVSRELVFMDLEPIFRESGVDGGTRIYFHLDQRRATGNRRRLDFELKTATKENPDRKDIRFRLAEASDGEFRKTAEGLRRRMTGTVFIPLEHSSASREVWYRLDLWGADLASARVLHSRPHGIFEATSAGRHSLVWGGAPVSSSSLPSAESTPLVFATWIEIDSMASGNDAPLPETAVGPAGPAPKGAASASWPILIEEQESDLRVIRLELPIEVYRFAQADLADLRLIHQGRQLPYLLDVEALPATEVSLRAAELTAKPTRNSGFLRIPVATSMAPWTQLELVSSAGPFERNVYCAADPATSRTGNATSSPIPFVNEHWSCSRYREPCAFSIDVSQLPRLAAEWQPGSLSEHSGEMSLEVVIEHGDNAPFLTLDADLHRRRHTLLFVLPKDLGRPIVLTTGLAATAPKYDLGAVADVLRLRSARKATVGPLEVGSTDPPWGRALLLASIAIAATLLLLLLGRVLKRPTDQPRGG